MMSLTGQLKPSSRVLKGLTGHLYIDGYEFATLQEIKAVIAIQYKRLNIPMNLDTYNYPMREIGHGEFMIYDTSLDNYYLQLIMSNLSSKTIRFTESANRNSVLGLIPKAIVINNVQIQSMDLIDSRTTNLSKNAIPFKFTPSESSNLSHIWSTLLSAAGAVARETL